MKRETVSTNGIFSLEQWFTKWGMYILVAVRRKYGIFIFK